MFLFHGLSLSARVKIEEGMALLPYEEVLRFLDQEFVGQCAPHGAGFHRWRSVGAVVRPFRWRTELRRRGSVNESARPSTLPFSRDAAAFLDLLAVSSVVSKMVCT